MQPWALITGATGGIGRELAHCFAVNRYNLILCGRRVDQLDNLGRSLNQKYGIDFYNFECDFGQPGGAENLWEAIKKIGVQPAILINNAGFGLCEEFIKLPLEDHLRIIQVNITSLITLTSLCLPSMIQRGYGRILNISSTAAFVPGPYMSVYFATKAFVFSFGQALSYELLKTGVTVTTLCPGITKTEFSARAGIAETWLDKVIGMSPRKVADIGFAGLIKGRAFVIPGLINKITVKIFRALPHSLVLAFVGRAQVPRK
jgi:uncharacterized protein